MPYHTPLHRCWHDMCHYYFWKQSVVCASAVTRSFSEGKKRKQTCEALQIGNGDKKNATSTTQSRCSRMPCSSLRYACNFYANIFFLLEHAISNIVRKIWHLFSCFFYLAKKSRLASTKKVCVCVWESLWHIPQYDSSQRQHTHMPHFAVSIWSFVSFFSSFFLLLFSLKPVIDMFFFLCFSKMPYKYLYSLFHFKCYVFFKMLAFGAVRCASKQQSHLIWLFLTRSSHIRREKTPDNPKRKRQSFQFLYVSQWGFLFKLLLLVFFFFLLFHIIHSPGLIVFLRCIHLTCLWCDNHAFE